MRLRLKSMKTILIHRCIGQARFWVKTVTNLRWRAGRRAKADQDRRSLQAEDDALEAISDLSDRFAGEPFRVIVSPPTISGSSGHPSVSAGKSGVFKQPRPTFPTARQPPERRRITECRSAMARNRGGKLRFVFPAI